MGGQPLFGDDGRAEDRCSVVTAPRTAGSMLGPESVDDLWSFPAVPGALVGSESRREDLHNVSGLTVYPAAGVATRTVCGVEGLDEWLDPGLDVFEKV